MSSPLESPTLLHVESVGCLVTTQAPALGKSHICVSDQVKSFKPLQLNDLFWCSNCILASVLPRRAFPELQRHLTYHVTECLFYRDAMSAALLRMPSTSPFLWYYLMFQRLPF